VAAAEDEARQRAEAALRAAAGAEKAEKAERAEAEVQRIRTELEAAESASQVRVQG